MLVQIMICLGKQWNELKSQSILGLRESVEVKPMSCLITWHTWLAGNFSSRQYFSRAIQ